MIGFWQVIRSRTRSLAPWPGTTGSTGQGLAAGTPAPAITRDPAQPRGAYIAVVVNGFENGELDTILDTIGRESAAAGLQPLIVTRTIDLAAARRRRMPVELVEDQAPHARAPDLPWRLRMDAQIRGLVRLWEPVAVASFARPAATELVRSLQTAINRHRGVP